ncbi:MAG: efflux RND transporter periplasmic adaptor subunit [Candidatus Hydrogenedentes bacterium]|nr:efflux RND transporter periplasmic adaptor subunit [Candidatus Hydrogenedentota bacterium]
MKKFLVSVGMCFGILAVCGGIVYWAAGAFAAKEAARANGVTETQIPNVKVQVLTAGVVEDRFTLTGTIDAWENVTLSSEVSGKIEARPIETGDLVKQGQDLFRIDTQALQTKFEQAEAQARWATQEFDRARKLADRGVSAVREQDSAVASRDVADAEVRATEILLRKSIVKAPFDGVVAELYSKQDEFSDVGNPLVRLVQVDRVKLRVGVPERDVSYFKAGDTVAVTLDAIADRMFSGVIHLIAPTADSVTHTFGTEIALDNADGCFKPGMIARAQLVRRTFAESIVAPLFATALIDDKRFVFVEKDGVAELRAVEVGVVQASNVQITSGLQTGDRLIVVGQRDARPGGRVNVIETVE